MSDPSLNELSNVLNFRPIPAVMWLIIGCAILFAFLQLAMPVFIYQRDLMWSEPWRWWTAQWVHVGWRHYGLNILALACLPFIIPHMSRANLGWAIIILSPLLSIGLYWFYPHVYAYAGFSGVLHGLYVWAALTSLLFNLPQETLKNTGTTHYLNERKFATLLLLAVVIKVLIEKKVGHTDTERLIQAPVLIEAHQIGVVVGVLYTSLQYIWFKFYDSRHKTA